MDAARAGPDGRGQGVGVGGFELSGGAVFEQALDDLVVGREGGEGLLVGGVLAGFGFLGRGAELQEVEEDLAELAGGVQVEGGAGEPIDGLLGFVHFLRELGGEVGQRGGVHGDALEFHVHEHGDQRRFDFVEDALLALLLEQRFEGGAELPGDIGVFGGVFGDFGDRHVGHVDLAGLGVADELADGDGGVAEIDFGEIIHAVAHLRFEEAVGDHGVEELAADRHALPFEDAEIELEVVADFFDALGFEHGAELVENRLGRGGLRGHGDIVADVGRERERQPDQARRFGIEAGGLGVEAEGVQVLAGFGEAPPARRACPRDDTGAGHRRWSCRLAEGGAGTGSVSAAAPSVSDTSTNCSASLSPGAARCGL